MSSLLYGQASPRGERSTSIAVADAFVNAYRKSHPSDTVTVRRGTSSPNTFCPLSASSGSPTSGWSWPNPRWEIRR